MQELKNHLNAVITVALDSIKLKWSQFTLDIVLLALTVVLNFIAIILPEIGTEGVLTTALASSGMFIEIATKVFTYKKESDEDKAEVNEFNILMDQKIDEANKITDSDLRKEALDAIENRIIDFCKLFATNPSSC